MTKATLMLKDPDGLYEFLSGDDIEKKKIIFEKFFEYGDYLQIEIDLDTHECRLVPISEY